MYMSCITSGLTNNAVGAVPGKSILRGQEPQDYADHILRLLDHPEKRERLAASGQRFVRNATDWDRKAERSDKLIFPVS